MFRTGGGRRRGYGGDVPPWTTALSSKVNLPHLINYPLSAETLEPLARFVRNLPKDSNLAEDRFPGLINQEFIGSFSTSRLAPIIQFVQLSEPDKLAYFLEFWVVGGDSFL